MKVEIKNGILHTYSETSKEASELESWLVETASVGGDYRESKTEYHLKREIIDQK